jgi:hypothetical protein
MKTIKAIIGVLAVVFVMYAGFQVIPPELGNYSFQDDLKNIAMMGGANPHQADQDLVDAVVKKAHEHDIPLTADHVTVQRFTSGGLQAVYLSADYSVPVNLPGYSFSLHFTPSSGNKGF